MLVRNGILCVGLVVVTACSEAPSAGSPGAGSGGVSAGGTAGGRAGGTSSAGVSGSVASAGTAGSSAGSTSGGAGGTAGTGTGGTGGTGGAPVSEPICPPGPFAGSPLPSANPSATSICEGFRFTEGPVWIASQGAVFFSDFEHSGAATNFNGDIVRFAPGGACSTFIPDVGTNGLAISTSGQLLGASHLTQTVTEFDLTTKAPTVVIDEFMNKKFSSPNDLTLHSNGNIYFTDPAWEVGNRQELLPRAAYYREPGGVVHVIEELNRPNGITLSPDEKHLYIATVGPTRVYDLDTDGVPSNGRTFVNSGSDGMAVDCAGNLYLTDSGVKVFDPAGTAIGTIQTPGGTTNAAFGGPDRKTLYITGGTQLYSIQLSFPGYPY